MDKATGPSAAGQIRYRTLFLSDFHLGKRFCRAALLLDFLKHNTADTIYLIGDIIDIWSLRKRMYWPASHERVLRHIIALARTGTQVIYLPGNHDDILRRATNLRFGPISFAESVQHHCADGTTYLVIHGDQYDVILNKARWLGPIGDWFYDLLLHTNATLNTLRRHLGIRQAWPISAFGKHLVKRAVNHASHFETTMVAELAARGLDGMICGHVHHAEMRNIQGFTYVNTGDWVESCTAVVEHHSGTLEVLHWPDTAPVADHTHLPLPGSAA